MASKLDDASSYALPGAAEPGCVLVTGGCGFIASHFMGYLAHRLTEAHARDGQKRVLVCVDALTYAANLDFASPDWMTPEQREAIDYVFVHGKVQDKDLWPDLLEEYTPHTVVHMAAETHVDASFDSSLPFTESNVLGTHVLLDAVASHQLKCAKAGRHACPVKRFLHMSTDEVYGESPLGFDNEDNGSGDEGGDEGDDDRGMNEETAVLNPTNPYAATKAAAELLVRSYATSYGLPAVVVRCNNVYGPRQHPEKVIPRFLTQMTSGEEVTLHGDGSALRSFIFVDDVSAALWVILERGGTDGQIYNIGTAFEISIRNMYTDLRKALKRVLAVRDQDDGKEGNIWKVLAVLVTASHLVSVEDRPFNDQRYWIDGTKLQSLGWSAQVDWVAGLEVTVKAFLDESVA